MTFIVFHKRFYRPLLPGPCEINSCPLQRHQAGIVLPESITDGAGECDVYLSGSTSLTLDSQYPKGFLCNGYNILDFGLSSLPATDSRKACSRYLDITCSISGHIRSELPGMNEVVVIDIISLTDCKGEHHCGQTLGFIIIY